MAKKKKAKTIASSNPNYRTSGMAIASFVLGFLGIYIRIMIPSILGLVFGLVALHEIKKSEGFLRGRGFALAGTILSTIGIILSILVFWFFLNYKQAN